jgi:hypothetical protein
MMIERRKVPDKQFFRRLGLLITSAIRHRLSAAGLIKWVHDIYLKFLQKLQSGDADFRIEKVNITGDHQSNLHGRFPHVGGRESVVESNLMFAPCRTRGVGASGNERGSRTRNALERNVARPGRRSARLQ